MPATTKLAPRPRATAAARAQADDDARRIDHIGASLEAAQRDLAAIGGSLGTGVHDLRRDVNRLLRDARRDLRKMRRAVQRDAERLQRDLTAAATAKPPASRHARTAPSKSQRPVSRQPVASAH
jgi:hypothetical protein